MLLSNAVMVLSIPKNIKTEKDLKERLPNDVKSEVDWLYLAKDQHSAIIWFQGKFASSQNDID